MLLALIPTARLDNAHLVRFVLVYHVTAKRSWFPARKRNGDISSEENKYAYDNNDEKKEQEIMFFFYSYFLILLLLISITSEEILDIVRHHTVFRIE